MGNILFGFRNLIEESTTTLTEGDEAGDYVAENLAIPSPEEYWRADDLTASYVQVDLGTNPIAPTLASVHFHTGTPRRSLLRDTSVINSSAKWTKSNSTVFIFRSVVSPVANAIPYQLTASGGPSTHYAEHDKAFCAYATRQSGSGDPSWRLKAMVYIRNPDGSAKAELEVHLNGSAETASIEVDPANGTVNTTNASANATVVVGTATAVTVGGVTWYRVLLVVDFDVAASATWDAIYRLYVLDSSYTRSYTTGGTPEQFEFAAPKLSVNGHPGDTTTFEGFEQDSAAGGAVWFYKAESSGAITPTDAVLQDYQSGPLSLCASEVGSDEWSANHAWVALSGADVQPRQHHLFEFHNPDNADSRIDASGIGLYSAFQPTVNVLEASLTRTYREKTVSGRYSPRGMRWREWQLELHYLTRAEAEISVEEIMLRAGRSRYVLVVLDPDDTVRGQQGCIYGKLSDARLHGARYSGTQGETVWAATFQVVEDVPA